MSDTEIMSFPPADVFLPVADGLARFRPTVDVLKVFHRCDGGCDLSLRVGEALTRVQLDRTGREHLAALLLHAVPGVASSPDAGSAEDGHG
jgi:hypothetical protein